MGPKECLLPFQIEKVGKRKHYDWNASGYQVITYGCYAVVDLMLSLTVKGNHNLSLTVSKLFDMHYFEMCLLS